MSWRRKWGFPAVAVAMFILGCVCSAHEAEDHPGSCLHGGHGSSSHDHDHHVHQHGHSHDHGHGHVERSTRAKLLPEELAEEEDLAVDGFTLRPSEGDAQKLSGMGLWVSAMGCSLLVSMASLICLITLPLIFLHGKPSKTVIECLALFGAGAMLGDAFLHQLPHAIGGGHSHSNAHHEDYTLDHFHSHEHEESHSHSLNDLSVGLSVLAGIVLFLLVEKFVRYAEDHYESGSWGLGHHHHHHKSSSKSKKHKNEEDTANLQLDGVPTTDAKCDASDNAIHKRSISTGTTGEKKIKSEDIKSSTADAAPTAEDASAPSRSNLVFGYLNLFSDGVHNFTDGMALGSAFLIYGSVGGWSRTLFLLAHELPQEVGDFGILIRSGFSVPKALFFNFLSALVALAGTALALLLGKDPGQSSLIEGFTAGGFIYIAVAGVLPEMNKDNTTIKTTVAQLTALILGMSVALCISLVE